MKIVILECIVVLSVSAVFAQASAQPAPEAQVTKEQVVEKVCRAPEITNGPEFDEMHRIEQRLGAVVHQDRRHRIYVALVNSTVINAWAENFNLTTSMICVPIAMVHFMGDAEGELAFILSHEVGHTVDDQCKTEVGRLAVANSRGSLGALLGGLLGGQQGAATASKISQQKGCEARADEIGFYIFTASGYDPYDAAGAFGRLEMYIGDTGTGVLARLSALGSDHPMTPDRIKHMRTLLINYALQTASKGR